MTWETEEERVALKSARKDALLADLDRLRDIDIPDEAIELLEQADELDEEARHNEELAASAITDRARRRCEWEANQLRGKAVRRYMEAQAIIAPLPDREELMRVGGVVTYMDEADDYAGYEIPDRVAALVGQDWV